MFVIKLSVTKEVVFRCGKSTKKYILKWLKK